MSDDTDDRTLQASAYLDNEVTPDERAQVETDPDSLAEVDELGQVRTVLGATAPQAPLSQREAHLAAALDVFDRMSDMERSGEVTPSSGVDAAAAAAVTTPLSSSDTGRHRRPERSRTNWLLGAAAGLLVLIGAGVVVSSVLNNSDGDDSNDIVADEAADSRAATEFDAVEDQENAEILESGSAELEVRPDLDSDDAAQDVPAQVEEDFTAASEAADDDADEAMEDEEAMEEDSADDLPDSAEQPSPPPDEDLVDLLTPEDLGDFAIPAATARESDGEPEDIELEPPFASCEAEIGVQRIAGPALYQGEPVIVGVDLVNNVVYAYTEDCTVVAETGLPEIEDLGPVDTVVSTQP